MYERVFCNEGFFGFALCVLEIGRRDRGTKDSLLGMARKVKSLKKTARLYKRIIFYEYAVFFRLVGQRYSKLQAIMVNHFAKASSLRTNV